MVTIHWPTPVSSCKDREYALDILVWNSVFPENYNALNPLEKILRWQIDPNCNPDLRTNLPTEGFTTLSFWSEVSWGSPDRLMVIPGSLLNKKTTKPVNESKHSSQRNKNNHPYIIKLKIKQPFY